MKLFVTGASGHLGRLLIERLARLPDVSGITAIDVAPPRRAFPETVSFRVMDVRSPELPRLLDGHDVVIHAAFVVMWKRRISSSVREDININGTHRIARAARECGIRRLIHISSIVAYDPRVVDCREGITEDSPLGSGCLGFYYADDKARAERVLEEVLGVAPTVLTRFRPTLIVGGGDGLNIKNPSFRLRGVDPLVQLVHMDDVASAVALATMRDLPGVYNLVSDDWHRQSVLQERMGVPPGRPVPIWAARLIAGLGWRFFGSPLHPSWIDSLHRFFTFSLSNAKLRAAGWMPLHTTESLWCQAR